MGFLSLAAKNLTRRPMRSLLTVFGLSVAVGAVVALRGISQGFETTFVDLYRVQSVDLVVQRVGGTVQLSLGLDEALQRKIEALPHVHQVVGGLMDVVAFEKYDLFAVIVNGWAPDCPVLQRETMLSGRRLAAGDEHKVMLGKVLAANLGKKVGDHVEMYAEPFEVVGIFESFSVYENGAVFVLLSELQRLMDRPRKLTGFVVQAEPSGDRSVVEDLKQRIETLDPTLNAVDTVEFVHGISQIRVTQAAAWVTSAVAMIVGIIGVLNTMVMSVFERTREIGTLRAIGWRKSRIIRLVICEALLISAVAAALGVMIGVVAVRITGRVPALSGLVEGNVPIQAVLAGCLMAFLVGLLGAIYPAYWAANLWPVQALRKR